MVSWMDEVLEDNERRINVYNKIVRARNTNKGITLTASEVNDLGLYDHFGAIEDEKKRLS